jgi:hypothetical protein
MKTVFLLDTEVMILMRAMAEETKACTSGIEHSSIGGRLVSMGISNGSIGLIAFFD